MTLKIESASAEIQELFKSALKVRENSYSPYSHCKVGAALKTSENLIFTGCNVENASYGGSICAERSAILKAVSDRGHLHIEAMMVVTDASPPWSPCGFCRQTIAEFGSNLMVYMANLKGELIALSFSELFPQGFSKDQLP